MKNEQVNQINKSSVKTYLKYGIVGLLFLAIISVYFWQEYKIKQLKIENETNITKIKQNANSIIDSNTSNNLNHLMKAYVWAIRKEILSKNIDQVNLYAYDMIKEKGFQSIIFCNQQGIIISSTNKKYENKPLSTFMDRSLLALDKSIVKAKNDSLYVASTPVMSFNEKLGTLIIEYKQQKIK